MDAEASGGHATATFALTDGAGAPVDREGRLTQGAVTVELGIAWLDQTNGAPGQYTSYVTRVQTSATSDDTGRAARRDPASCAGCHGGPGEILCVGCHKVGGVGGSVHPPGWSSRQSLGDLPCRLCHVGSR